MDVPACFHAVLKEEYVCLSRPRMLRALHSVQEVSLSDFAGESEDRFEKYCSSKAIAREAKTL